MLESFFYSEVNNSTLLLLCLNCVLFKHEAFIHYQNYVVVCVHLGEWLSG